jgi:hypothetical protein
MLGFLLICLQQIDCGKSKKAEVLRSDWGKIYTNPTFEEHQKNLDLWKARKPKHFRYKARVSCFCTIETGNDKLLDKPELSMVGTRWVIIEISNGKIFPIKNIDGTANNYLLEVLEIYKEDIIDSAFNWISGDIKNHFNQVVIYDPNFGFPRYQEPLDNKRPVDSGGRIEIIEFEVLPEILKGDDYSTDELLKKNEP